MGIIIVVALGIIFAAVVVYFAFFEEKAMRRAQRELDIRAALPDYYNDLVGEVSNIKNSGDFLRSITAAKMIGARIREVFAPDINCQGLVMEQSFDMLGGEELIDLAADKKFIAAIAKDLARLAEGNKERNELHIFSALSDLSHIILTRGAQFSDETQKEWLSKYISDLQECINATDQDNPARARDIMRDWYRAWRDPKEPTMTARPLPPEAMALALIANEAVLGIYGDTLDWLNADYLQRANKQVSKLLRSVKAELEHEEPQKTVRQSAILQVYDAEVFAARRSLPRSGHRSAFGYAK